METEKPRIDPDHDDLTDEAPSGPIDPSPTAEGTPMGVDRDDEVDETAQPGIPTEGEPPASE